MSPLEVGAGWQAAGHAVALATVVETWGSAPVPAGAHLVVRDDGAFEGSVSGGCVEAQVIEVARALLRGGPPRLLELGVDDACAQGVGLPCGGTIRVFVGPLGDPAPLLRARAARRSVLSVTRLDTGAREVREEASARPTPQLDGDRLIQPHVPPLRLVLVGASHVAQAVCEMAIPLDLEVTVVDPRAAWLTEARFPRAGRVVDWPGPETLALDARAGLVALSHDPKIDDPALAHALGTDALYVGALGSRRSHEARLDRLRAEGWEEAALSRIHGPVGLPLGARTPAEIALSILAELVRVQRAPYS